MDRLLRLTKIGLATLATLFALVLLGLSLPIGGRRTMSVQTGSMVPAIGTGSLVVVNKVPVSQLKNGDVITFVNPENVNQTITHRIVKVTKRSDGVYQFVTKGDANRTADRPITGSDIVGKVTGSVPYVGRVFDFLRTWPGLILMVYVPALIVVGIEMRKLMAYYKSQEPYVLPEVLAARKRTPSGTGRHLLTTSLIAAAVVVGLAAPTFATPQADVSLQGSTIRSVKVLASTDNHSNKWKCKKTAHGYYCEKNCWRDHHRNKHCSIKRVPLQ